MRHMKGAAFEREICKKLSLWASKGERDDIFWRTAGSGARATQRRKHGKQTLGQEGDVCATDPLGKTLCDKFVISLKTGYCRKGYYDVLDLVDSRKKKNLLLEWWHEIADVAEQIKKEPLLIVRREQRKPLLVTKQKLPLQPVVIVIDNDLEIFIYAFYALLQQAPEVLTNLSVL